MSRSPCARCNHPITSNDRFCPGCGQAATAEQSAQTCPSCAKPVGEGQFCNHCGAKLLAGSATATIGFQWKWAAVSVPIAIGTMLLFVVFGGIVCAVTGADPKNPALALLVLVLGLFTAGLLAGFISPTRTVLEPGVGIAVTLVVMNLLLGDASGALFGWLIPFAIGALGAALGEYLQRLKTA